MYLLSDVLLLGLVDFFVFQFITEAREFIDVALDMFLPFLSALTRRFTNNQESIDVSFLAICSDLLLGLSCVFAFSAVVDERMHISSMMAQPISSREARNSAMGGAETRKGLAVLMLQTISYLFIC